MLNFKEKLAQELTKAVINVMKNAELFDSGETNEGFFCDYDMKLLNPESFKKISEQMDLSK